MLRSLVGGVEGVIVKWVIEKSVALVVVVVVAVVVLVVGVGEMGLRGAWRLG